MAKSLWRVRLELELHGHEEKERMDVTGGGEQEYLRWGERGRAKHE